MNENDILIYMDSGCAINQNGKKRIFEYIDMLNSSDKCGILSFQMDHLPEIKYTKNGLLSYLETNVNDMMTGQCMATVVVLKKNNHSVHVVNEWFRIASIPSMINDTTQKENDLYIAHRHDQSILSLLVKKYGSIKIPDETYFAPDWSRGINYPFWAVRERV
jgi:hypothetical protein